MTSKQALHNDIIAAVLKNLGENLSPKDVLEYFETASKGLSLMLSFCPSVEQFKEFATAEMEIA